MNLAALPAFSDNYIWMLHDGIQALVVDPGDAAPVEASLTAHRLSLTGILVTHHHADHQGGVTALRARWPQATVLKPANDPVTAPGHACAGGEALTLGPWRLQVLAVPGHTLGHVAFLVETAQAPAAPGWLFCGDTLFSAGCGRMFEGTPAQMQGALARLAALPDDTWVCSAHEYTVSNLRFAAAAEPDNADVAEWARHCQALRADGQPTLPSTVARERRINPFLRTAQPGLRAGLRARGMPCNDDIEAFASLRRWKDEFR